MRFGPFEANTYTGELHKNGTRIKLAPQAFQILALLAGRAGELITREEIQRVVWPNETIVEFDHSINTAVKRIREALNDSRGEPQYLETLPRRGGVNAAVSYAGLVSPGLIQVNVQIPQTAAAGNQQVLVTYIGATSPSGVVIPIGN